MTEFFLAFALLMAAGSARAAAVYLKEGGRLEGVLVSSTDTEIVLDTSQGRVSVDMHRVKNIDYTQGPSAEPTPAPVPVQEERPLIRSWRVAAADGPLFEARQQMLSIDLGFAAPLSGVSLNGSSGGGSANNGDVGPAVGLQYLYFMSPRVGLGLESDYYERGAADSPNLLPSSESHVFGDTTLLLGVAKFSLTDRGPVRPFVLFGAGGYRATTVVDAEPQSGSSWSDTNTGETRRLVDGSAYGAAGTVRLGLDFVFSNLSVFGLEAGWTGLTSAFYQATPQGRALGVTGISGPLTYFTFTGRWGFSF